MILHRYQGALQKDFLLFLTILRQMAFSYKKMKQIEYAVQYYLQLYEVILDHEMHQKTNITPIMYFKNEAIDYLNSNARKMQQSKNQKNVLYSKAIEKLHKSSQMDISLQWLYIDLENDETGANISGNDYMKNPSISINQNKGFKFLKLQELFEVTDDKTKFYQIVKKSINWAEISNQSSTPTIKHLNQKNSSFNQPIEVVYKAIRNKPGDMTTVFFGFLISTDYIKQNLIPSIITKHFINPVITIKISELPIVDKEGVVLPTQKGIAMKVRRQTPLISSQKNKKFEDCGTELMAVPFQTLLNGQRLVLSSLKENFFQSTVKKEIYLYYFFISIFIITFIFGIFLLYKYLSRETALLQLKAEFIEGASHTLKTPLTRISLMAENIKNGWLTEKAQKEEFLDSIIEEISQMGEMINNMLNFSRIEAGKYCYKPEMISLQKVTSNIMNRFTSDLKRLGFQLDLNMSDHLPEFLFDFQALEFIVFNLLQNAIKYSVDEKYIKITAQHQGEYLKFQIEDRGIGIEKDQISTVLKKFSRGTDPRVKNIEGSGLGLYLVRHALEAHHAKLLIDSNLNKGTTVTIHFPIQQIREEKIQ